MMVSAVARETRARNPPDPKVKDGHGAIGCPIKQVGELSESVAETLLSEFL